MVESISIEENFNKLFNSAMRVVFEHLNVLIENVFHYKKEFLKGEWVYRG